MKTTISLWIHKLNIAKTIISLYFYVLPSFLSRVVSRISFSRVVLFWKVRPRPDVAVLLGFVFWLFCFVAFYFVGLERRLCCRWPALCLLLLFSRRTRSRGGEEPGVFVLFLVQYAVHKSLALEILWLFFLFVFFLLSFNGYIAVFLSFFLVFQ